MLGVPRSRTMLNVVRAIQPSFVPIGHDGGINVANGVREYHGIACTPNPNASFQHCIPTSYSLGESEFVHNEIFRRLGLSSHKDNYPPEWAVGEGTQSCSSGAFAFAYDPFCASNSLEITGCNLMFRNARQAAAMLLTMLETFPQVRHVRLTVLIDKTEFIQRLVDAGFEITAYLPVWYPRGRRRYDCVLLVRGSFSQEPVDHGIRDVVEGFRCGLNQSQGVLRWTS
jgi:hypothetical protein